MLARLTGLTCCGLFLVMMSMGRDLSPDEQAQWDARTEGRVPVLAALTGNFAPETKRQGRPADELVTQVAQLPAAAASKTRPSVAAELHLAGFSDSSSLPTPTKPAIQAPTVVADPEKLAALLLENAAKQADPASAIELREVSGNRVNVRSGPSTSDAVLGQVVRAEIVQLLSEPKDGWVKISVQGDGVEGYMAARFLTEYVQ